MESETERAALTTDASEQLAPDSIVAHPMIEIDESSMLLATTLREPPTAILESVETESPIVTNLVTDREDPTVDFPDNQADLPAPNELAVDRLDPKSPVEPTEREFETHRESARLNEPSDSISP